MNEFEELKYKLFKAKKVVSKIDKGILEKLAYFNVTLPGGKNDNAAEKAQYQTILMERYLEQFKHHKDYVNKVKNFQNLSPLKKIQIKQAQADKLGESIRLDASQLKKQVFDRLKDTEEDQIREIRKYQTLQKLHMVKPMLQNIRIDEHQARDVVQPERKMCSSTVMAHFLAAIVKDEE